MYNYVIHFFAGAGIYATSRDMFKLVQSLFWRK